MRVDGLTDVLFACSLRIYTTCFPIYTTLVLTLLFALYIYKRI